MWGSHDDRQFAELGCRLIDDATSIELAVLALRDYLEVEHVIFHSSRLGGSPAVEPYVRLTYTGSWIKRYIQMDYMSIDPVLREGFTRDMPFDWGELSLNTHERAMIADAIAHGVGPQGLSVPVRATHGHRALFSITSSVAPELWQQFRRTRTKELVDIAHHIHKRAIREQFGDAEPRLTRREVDCLFWTGEGKEATDIAAILQISRHTVRDYLKSARWKLDCVTSTQAVNKAMKLGLLPVR